MTALSGVTVVEFAALGPASYATMLLADMGAEVIRIERPSSDPAYQRDHRYEHYLRGRRSITVDLRLESGKEVARRLIAGADVLIEAGRPGNMERLGLGPDDVLPSNPGLIYARLTGWGQTGPRATTAGHDINYIALVGALHAIGPKGGPPTPPMGLVGDFAGGAMFLVLGICAALYERASSGRGQVIDAAMIDGAASLMSAFYGQLASGEWIDERGSNRVDGGAPFYRAYECSDGRYVAVGAIEERFFQILAVEVGLDLEVFGDRWDRDAWSAQAQLLEQSFRQHPRDHWAAIFADTDGCVTPILGLQEAPDDVHLRTRSTFLVRDGLPVPAPAPRLSRTPSRLADPPVQAGSNTTELLMAAGMTHADVERLLVTGAVVGASDDAG